jgi:predicted Ser/Thr protein kinase
MTESPKTVARYEIIDMLGKGAMGVVYKARDPNIDRFLAIKTIKTSEVAAASDGEDVLARFKREVQTAGELIHANIVTIYDGGQDGDLHWLAMEFVDGPSLAKLISDKLVLPLQDILTIFVKICSAVDFAHRHGIVHRDLKPANILLTKDWEPKIADFGIARIASSTMTRTGVILGTPSYMSPEQITGQRVDSRSDIFSLGIILYELLTGERPYLGENPTVIMYKIVHSEPVSPDKINLALPEGLASVIMKALAKNPEARYQRAGEMAGDIIELVKRSPELSISTSRLDMPTAIFPSGPVAVGLDRYESVDAPPVARKSRMRAFLLIVFLLIVAGGIAGGLYLYRDKLFGGKGGNGPGVTNSAGGGTGPVARQITKEITVGSEPPGAEVYIDGKLQEGATPLTFSLTRAGGSAALLLVEKDCFKLEQEIRFDNGDPQDFNLELKRKVRTIAVTSEPEGASVSVNGERKGNTPLSLDIECGLQYQVVVSSSGFRTNTTPLEWDSVGQDGRLAVALEPATPGKVVFQGRFAVNIMRGGRTIAQNVNELELPPGRHSLTLVNRQLFYTSEQTFELAEGQRLSFELPRTGLLNVFPRPPANCVIKINGFTLNQDEIPLRKQPVAAGSFEISFAWGSTSRSKIIEVPPGKVVTVGGTPEEITVRVTTE